jgi:hypothetical protein
MILLLKKRAFSNLRCSSKPIIPPNFVSVVTSSVIVVVDEPLAENCGGSLNNPMSFARSIKTEKFELTVNSLQLRNHFGPAAFAQPLSEVFELRH